MGIYTHFENYTKNLRLDDAATSISPSDPRLLCNNPLFMRAKTDLAGFHLKAAGYPKADEYSDERFHDFIFGVRSRMKHVMEEKKAALQV